MLSNEERNRLVETFNQFHDAVKTAKIYSVSVGSVYRLVRQMKDTGSVDLKTGSRGRKPVLSPEDIENIRRTVLEQPDITIHELTVQLNLSASEETVRTRVVELGLRYKKNASRLGTGAAGHSGQTGMVAQMAGKHDDAFSSQTGISG